MRLSLPTEWESWPGWPWLLSVWFHLLIVIYPVSVGDPSTARSATHSARLEVRLAGTPALPQPDSASRASPLPASAQSPEPSPIALPVPNRYFNTTEVETKAEPLEVAPLIFPEEAYVRRLSGQVTLRLYINETGGIDSIDVIDAEPAGLFDQAAIDATLATRFRPATLLTRPVKSVKTIVVRFDPFMDR